MENALQILQIDNNIELYKVPSMDMVIEDFLKKFNSIHTVRRYRKVLCGFFEYAGVGLISDLTEVKFDVLLQKIREYAGVIENTRSRVNTLNIIRSFFNYLEFTYNYPRNPVSKQAFDMKLDRNSSSTVSLSEVELIQLLNELKKNKHENQKSYRDYLLVSTMLTTSLRIAEVLQMDVSLIKTDNITGQNYIEIIQKKNRVRKVLIPQKLLEKYMEYTGIYNVEGPIFTNIKNNVSERAVLTQFGSFKIIKGLVEKYLNKTGIGNHSLRKSFIELANKRKISPVSIMKATGHNTLQMIKYYNTTDELSDNASSDIAKILLE